MYPNQNEQNNNPQYPPQNPQGIPVPPPINPATYVPVESTPEADTVAMQAIETLETERVAPQPYTAPAPTPAPIEPSAPVVDAMTPFVSSQPTYTAQDVAPVAFPEPQQAPSPVGVPIAEPPTAIGTLGTINAAPVQIPTPQPYKNKFMSKKHIIITVILVIGLLVAGYFIVQAMQSGSANPIQTTGGDLPGGTTTPNPSDSPTSSTPSSV